MKFKSILALLLAVMMVVTVFAGCGKKENTTTPTTTSSQTTDTTQQQPQEKKEIEISIAFWDLQFGDDEIGKKISDDLKVKIRAVNLSWDNDLETIKLYASTGMMPDVISTYTVDYDSTRFYQWIDQGLLRDIPESLVAKYPTVKSMFDGSLVLNAVKQLKDGKYWFIPRPESVKGYYQASHQVIYYRKDWMANVGITEVPKTVDDFYNMLKAFTTQDPNQNNKADTYGLTMANLNTAPFAIWGIDPEHWVQEDGKWIPGYFSKKNVEPLKYFRKLYAEGLLDPEFTKNGWKQAVQKFTTNTFGVLIRNGDLHWINKTIIGNWAVANPEVTEPLSAVGVLPPLTKDAGSQPQWPVFISTGGSEISSAVDDEKLDRILELYEYLLQPDVRTMLAYGFEGVDYKKDGDKIIPEIDPETGAAINIRSKYPSTSISCLTDWYWDDDIENPNKDIAPEVKDLAKSVRDQFNPIALDTNIAVGYISTPTKDLTPVTWRDNFVQIVIGTEDVASMFDRFVADTMALGMGTAIEEVNAEVQRLGIK